MAEYIEDCFSLTPSIVNRNFMRVRKIGSPIDERRTDINYWTDRDADGLLVSVGGREPQRIGVEIFDPPEGVGREYFLCGCGRRVFKLYLPPGQTKLKCRQCYKLRYRLTSFNPSTRHGTLLYLSNRMDKLSQARIDIRTPIYQGRYTRRFERFLRMCGRAGLHDVVRNANTLMTTLHTFQPSASI